MLIHTASDPSCHPRWGVTKGLGMGNFVTNDLLSNLDVIPKPLKMPWKCKGPRVAEPSRKRTGWRTHTYFLTSKLTREL